jgi:hypothetical protein
LDELVLEEIDVGALVVTVSEIVAPVVEGDFAGGVDPRIQGFGFGFVDVI